MQHEGQVGRWWRVETLSAGVWSGAIERAGEDAWQNEDRSQSICARELDVSAALLVWAGESTSPLAWRELDLHEERRAWTGRSAEDVEGEESGNLLQRRRLGLGHQMLCNRVYTSVGSYRIVGEEYR